jgi:transposase
MGKRFNKEFIKEAVDLVLVQRMKMGQVCSDLGVSRSSLDKWLRVQREQNNDPNALKESERDELKRLRKENHILKIERDLLKKTTVYFAKTSQEGANS